MFQKPMPFTGSSLPGPCGPIYGLSAPAQVHACLLLDFDSRELDILPGPRPNKALGGPDLHADASMALLALACL